MTTEQVLGLITGVLFGVLLQRGGVIRFEKQVGMLLFRDMTVLRFMLAAIIVGMVGMAILSYAGVISFSHKPMNMGGIIIGGSLFGAGWALAGLCPGTALGALGEGRVHAIFTVAGMIAGAMIFAHTYDFLAKTVLGWKDYGRLGLPDVLGIPAPLLIIAFAIGAFFIFRAFDKKGL